LVWLTAIVLKPDSFDGWPTFPWFWECRMESVVELFAHESW
jgi:hypothetical protein